MATTKKNPYGEPWRPSKGRLEVPDYAPPQPWKFKDDAAVALGWFWYEGRLWQKPPAFRDWAHEFAFRCGRMAASERVWMGHGLIRALVANPPAKPEPVPEPVAQPVEKQPDATLSPQMSSLLATLTKHMGIEPEIIDGANVEDTGRDCVDLSIAFSPVLTHRVEMLPDNGPPYDVPEPAEVRKADGGRYMLVYPERNDFEMVSAESLKVMRARYLLLRGLYYRHMRVMSHPDRQKVIAWYFDGAVWTPQEGSALAAGMGMVGETATA